MNRVVSTAQPVIMSQLMPRKPAKDSDDDKEKKEITFTFRVPAYLQDAWKRRMKKMPFKVSKQAYLMKLLEEDLMHSECITLDELDELKEQHEAEE